LWNKNIVYHINPTGKFLIGGPHGDSGVTGRKIIVDTYGGMGSHGGGAFSGKDPSKVDRSACYMARYVAKNIVAAGLAERVEVQLGYAIGVAEPVSVLVDTEGTSLISEDLLSEVVRELFDLRPRGIVAELKLLRRSTAKPLATATSAANCPSSPGNAPTRSNNSRNSPAPATSRWRWMIFRFERVRTRFCGMRNFTPVVPRSKLIL